MLEAPHGVPVSNLAKSLERHTVDVLAEETDTAVAENGMAPPGMQAACRCPVDQASLQAGGWIWRGEQNSVCEKKQFS